MVVARKAGLAHFRQNFAHDAAKRVLNKDVVSDLIVGHSWAVSEISIHVARRAFYKMQEERTASLKSAAPYFPKTGADFQVNAVRITKIRQYAISRTQRFVIPQIA
ncbi:hypothetical protein GCM10010136_25080 [Limoniibacter endophyticus]|uniref:Uncharacterized protein n=1 Tax=Limoniibacter endophyticus TaxID=1565040 RepID=A0A8J3GGX1_9HYPH|nr:hypothetical protein GCM10010136_25080 [Limoniibacter endophyticus]